jgi:outer membrane lipopolysaccharide assembly protein LptE/RlpB
MKTARLLTLLVPLLLFLHACGYELVRERGIFGGDITSVNVPVFKNRTLEPQVPAFFTEAFSRELAASGLLQINRAGSDSTVQGTIDTVTTVPSSLSGQGLAVEKQVTAVVSLTLTRQGQVVRTWAFGDSEAYPANDINQEDFNKRQALQRIAARMARRLHAQLLAIY